MIVLPFYNRISSFFGRRKAPKAGASTNHKGVDIAADGGAPICAAKDGTIVAKEYQKGYGNVVYINHPDGTQTRYAHMANFANIKVGDQVSCGQQIGFVGTTGVSTGNHLHFELRDANGNPVDPLPLLNGDTSCPIAKNYNPTWQQSANLTTPDDADKRNKQADIANMLSMEYRKEQEALQKKAAQKPSFTRNILKKGGWVTMLIGAAVYGTEENKYESVRLIDLPPTKKLNISISDMSKMGFTNKDINTLAKLSAPRTPQQTQGNPTLRGSGCLVTDRELAQAGFSQEKIDIINSLYDQQVQNGK